MKNSILKSVILIPASLIGATIALLFILSFIGYINLIVRIYVSGF
jgi:hypothetical protein